MYKFSVLVHILVSDLLPWIPVFVLTAMYVLQDIETILKVILWSLFTVSLYNCYHFAGTARTSLIVTIGPSPRHRGETASTILFGQRVSSVVFTLYTACHRATYYRR